MTTSTAIGLMAAAGVIGVTHAVEPDHVAGISALTDGAGDKRLAAVVGGCFAIGHVALVVAWLVGATLLLGVTSFPPILETVGLVVVGIVLVGLSVVLGVSAARRLVHKHEHRHDGHTHAHFHLHGLGDHGETAGAHRHEHTVIEYLKIGTVGALFTLSPPLSMIAFISVVLTSAPPAVVVPVVLAYAVAITVTMGLIGYGAGTVFRLARSRGPRVHATLQLAVAGIVLAVAVVLLGENLPTVLGW